jgi:hypothetical protein
MCTQFTIYGERCSGTNYLESLILENFNISITWKYGWKHFFGFYDFKTCTTDDDQTLFIGIVRNPVLWIQGFYSNPHHVPTELKSIIPFLSKEFYSVNDDGTLRIEDLNYMTHRKYTNIFELRRCKNHYLMNVMKTNVKNYILINYERLKDDTFTCLHALQKQFNLERKSTIYRNVDYYKKNKILSYADKKNKNKLPNRFISIILRSIDISQESMLGYTFNTPLKLIY